jgi:CRISPR-associated endonuclease/helicase Cas3
MASFDKVFKQATGCDPYPYQKRLATSAELPQLLDVPTGLGKTAAVVLAWLYRRRFADEKTCRSTPRRLVYCLPMRVLVEQTSDNARKWLSNLGLLGEPDQGKVSVHLLMGGDLDESWQIHPEADCILIGTQDMLLSRALNRGYAMSRYRWPMHFGLLNNDCLWVMDETQLMGVGVETSAQLAAFREKLGAHGNSQSLWMSATLGQAQLDTVDHPKPPAGWRVLGLEKDDLAKPDVKKRIRAPKIVKKLDLALTKDKAKSYPKDLAAVALREHQAETLTLVVVNQVGRAQEVYQQLLKQGRKESNTALIHSRFREADRKKQERVLFGSGDRIVIATQAVEAGVDVSSHTLITELAPWPSLVQRVGRCNRYGEFTAARVLWVDISASDGQDTLALPYSLEDLKTARTAIQTLTDAGPEKLKRVPVPIPVVVRPVLRRKDLLDLFDTTPDLSGNDLDISRFVRDGEDTDVQIFWRDVDGDIPPQDAPEPSCDELVRVSIGRFRDFLKKTKPRAWHWNPLEERWDKVSHPRPGQMYLIARANGGYSDSLGWTGDPADVPALVQPASGDSLDANDANKQTFIGQWVELTAHLEHVTEEARKTATQLSLGADLAATLIAAARWHDVGKAHHCFQEMLASSGTPPDLAKLWAKSDSLKGTCKRKGFRHELASALAWLQLSTESGAAKNLISYLIAAHHGRVRLSIRSLPNETEPPETDRLFARGIWHGDELPAVSLGDHETTPAVSLDLSLMQMGDGPHGESWLARMLALRDDPATGPFRLAYLETLVRVADWRASELEKPTP